jgi:uncharacterized protein (TIGR02118 family)
VKRRIHHTHGRRGSVAAARAQQGDGMRQIGVLMGFAESDRQGQAFVAAYSRRINVIKVSVLYPNTAGCRFDMGYYLNQHMPMVQQKLGPACKRMAVEEGIAGGAPGTPATYVAMGYLYFDSTDAFQSAFAPHAQAILADIPNYTNTQPTIQISEVKL